MQEIENRQTKGFSTGQKMKVALARTLVHKPGNILLDEPTSGLDVQAKRNLRAVIRNMRDDGMCVILSTHIMEEVEWLCDRVFIIHEGETRAEGSVKELKKKTQKDRFEDAFVNILGFES